MIDTDVYVMEGAMLPFQEVGVPFRDFPAPGNMLTWDDGQKMMVITTGVEWGAVHFCAEELSEEPQMDERNWDEMQEVSVSFGSGDVRLLDLEETP